MYKQITNEYLSAIEKGELSRRELQHIADAAVKQLAKLEEVVRLEGIGRRAYDLKAEVERSLYRVGQYVVCNFKTRGLHLGVIVKKNPKRFNIVLLSPGMGYKRLPRNSRQWRVGVGTFERIIDRDEAERIWSEEMRTEEELRIKHRDWF